MVEAENTCALVDWEALQNGETEVQIADDKKSIRTEDDSKVEEEPGYSIFKELFSKCDEDSKLILLNEIPELGDHRELLFLDTLKKDSSSRIRKMAEEVRNKLQKRLQAEAGKMQEKESLIKWSEVSQPGDMLNFDLEELKKQG